MKLLSANSLSSTAFVTNLNLSILLIEHDMKVVMGISDRVSVMEYGSKNCRGNPR